MGIVSRVSDLIFSLGETEETGIISIGDFAVIQLGFSVDGEIYIRVVKHGSSEDLFPAEFLVSKESMVFFRKSTGTPAGIKYDLEIHVEIQNTALLQYVKWDTEVRTGIFIRNGRDIREYTNDKIELRVLDFDVVDENGDGIFEPGQMFRVENIKVQNFGMFFH
jgi:hypothetical protein